MKKALLLLSLLVLTVSLTACGGSSGSSSTPDTPVTPVAELSGAVAAAPVKDAAVMVDFKYLTTAAQKAMKTEAAIVVGTTDANGAIVFDAAEVAKLDREQTIIMYSKDGVKFSSEYNTRKMVTEAKASETANYFYGSMRAVLVKGQTEAYLTMANTLVAELVEDEMTVAEAKEMVLNLVENRLGVTAMADPFGNPLTSLEKSEFVSQSIMSILDNVKEETMTAGTAKFGDVKAQVEAVATAADYDAMIVLVKKALDTDAYDPDMGELAKADVVASAAITYELSVTNNSTTNKTYKEYGVKADVLKYVVKAADVNDASVTMQFIAVAKTNAAVDANAGGYIIESITGQGKLKQGSLDVAVGTYFNSTNTFTIVPPKDSDGAVIKDGFSAASFTLIAVDADKKAVKNIKPVVISFTTVDASAIIVKDNSLTATTDELFTIALDKVGTIVTPTPTTEAKIKGGSTTDAVVTFTGTIDFINANKAEERDNTYVRFTAPANYAFVNVTTTGLNELTRVIKADEKVTVVEVKAALGAQITPAFKANVVRIVETSTFFEKKDMKVDVVANGKVIAEKTYAIGFAADSTYFAKIRDYKLSTASSKEVAAKTVAKEFSGKLTATYSTWEYQVKAANKSLVVGDITDTFNTFYVLKDDTDDEYMYKAVANGATITPAKSFDTTGVVTAEFDLADTNGAPTSDNPLSITFAADGTHYVRIAPKSVTTTLDKELPTAGGVEVEVTTATAIASGKLTSSPLANTTVAEAAAATETRELPAVNAAVEVVPSAATKIYLETISKWTVSGLVTTGSYEALPTNAVLPTIKSVVATEVANGYTLKITFNDMTVGTAKHTASSKTTGVQLEVSTSDKTTVLDVTISS